MTKSGDHQPLTPLSMAILLALADGDRHGYALMKEIETQTDGMIRPGTGSLYAGLQRLMAGGLIRESDGEEGADRRRRYYAITADGREVARAEAQRMWRVVSVASSKEIVQDLLPAID